MNKIVMDIALGWARTLIAAGAGYFVAKGYIGHDQAVEVEGAVAALVPIVFSAVDKYVAANRTVAAAATGKA